MSQSARGQGVGAENLKTVQIFSFHGENMKNLQRFIFQ